MPPLVSFIIANWNGESYLQECLDSILQQTHRPLEIIVVDNGSKDKSLEILRSFSAVQLICNDENLGFGPANNQALLQSKGEFVALLNNDAVLDPHWTAAALSAFDDSTTGMCAGKTLSYFDRSLIDNTGHLLYWDGVNRGRGRMQRDHGQFDHFRTALFPSGCACMLRSGMLREIGYFDEDFYLYGDDTEIGLRARLAGWECAFVPSAIAYHRYSASTETYHPSKFYFVERNRCWVALKYFPMELLLLNPVFSVVRWFFHLIALIFGKGVSGEFARRKNPVQLAGLWWNAQVSAWKGLPRFWRKRRELFRKFHWTRKRFYQCFWPHRLPLLELTFLP